MYNMQVSSLGLMTIDTEWLYMISDTQYLQNDVASMLKKAKDGNNIAFVYNSSKPYDESCKVSITHVMRLSCRAYL